MIDLNSLSEEEINELRRQISIYDYNAKYNRNVSQIIENRKYIGKCYYDETKHEYIKVLSSKSSNEYRFECLTFSYPIKCHERTKLSKFTGNACFSVIDNKFVAICDYPLLCNGIAMGLKYYGKVINNLHEITNDEFESALRRYVEDLINEIDNGTFDTSRNVEYRT